MWLSLCVVVNSYTRDRSDGVLQWTVDTVLLQGRKSHTHRSRGWSHNTGTLMDSSVSMWSTLSFMGLCTSQRHTAAEMDPIAATITSLDMKLSMTFTWDEIYLGCPGSWYLSFQADHSVYLLLPRKYVTSSLQIYYILQYISNLSSNADSMVLHKDCARRSVWR